MVLAQVHARFEGALARHAGADDLAHPVVFGSNDAQPLLEFLAHRFAVALAAEQAHAQAEIAANAYALGHPPSRGRTKVPTSNVVPSSHEPDLPSVLPLESGMTAAPIFCRPNA